MRILVAIFALAPVACASPPRAPAGTCMQQTVDALDLAGLSNDQKHCLASGSIALRCGTLSAWAAGYGKEMADLIGPGNFQRRDLRANAAGRACADRSTDDGELPACCASAGF